MKKTKIKKETIKPIPPFKTLEEEANFWDTHSIVDEINEGAIVGFHRAKKTGIVTVRMAPKDLQQLREKAFQMGVGPTTLARMWLIEKLRTTSNK